MALQTKILAVFRDGQVRYEIDYDDVTLEVSLLRCVNASGDTSPFFVGRIDGSGTRYQGLSLPGLTTEIIVPSLPATRIVLSPLAGRSNHLNGLDARFASS